MKGVLRAIPRIGLGLVFVVAGLLKGADPSEFVRQVGTYGILTGRAAAVFAYLLIPVEVGLGVALLAGFLPRLSSLAASLLMLLFMGASAYGWATGRTEGCGCFGSLASRTPGEVLLEDAGFLALGVLALYLGRAGAGRGWRRGAVVAAAVAASVLLSVFAYSLPLDSLVTRLRVGTQVASLPLRESPVDLATGDHLVALIDLGSPDAGATVKKLNAFQKNPDLPQVVAFYGGEVDEKTVFCFNYSPDFEVVPMLRSDFKTLYRKLPRFFRVRDGRVVRIWNGAPPGPEDLG